MKFSAVSDWFVPEEIKKDLIEYGKYKTIISVGLFISLFVFIYSITAFATEGIGTGFIVFIFSMVFLAACFLMKYTGIKELSGNIIIGCLLLLQSILINLSRTSDPSMTIGYNAILVILLSFMFFRLKGGIIWSVIVIGTMSVFNYLQTSGVGIDIEVTDINRTHINSIIFLLILTTILAIVWEYVSSKNLSRFFEERAKSDEQTRNLRMALDEVKQSMEAATKNDLSRMIGVEFPEDLKLLKESVNSTISVLNHTLSQVATVSGDLNSGTEQVANAADALADGNSKQAASLEQISSSMSEIENQSKTASENAVQSQQLTHQTLDVVKEGNKQMEEMLQSINQINETSSNVSKVIKAIDEIAFQTNLLALNAAVEAARAGKYGKGFSVVAEEVRSLAGRSAEAARNTTDLIEASAKEVEKGVQNADLTAEVFNKISESITMVNDLIGEIASSAEEQKSGISEINGGLAQVNEVVQQNSSISEQTAASSKELKAQAGQLLSMMQAFKLKSSRDQREIRPQRVQQRAPRQEPRPVEKPKSAALPASESQKNRMIVLDDDDFGKY